MTTKYSIAKPLGLRTSSTSVGPSIPTKVTNENLPNVTGKSALPSLLPQPTSRVALGLLSGNASTASTTSTTTRAAPIRSSSFATAAPVVSVPQKIPLATSSSGTFAIKKSAIVPSKAPVVVAESKPVYLQKSISSSNLPINHQRAFELYEEDVTSEEESMEAEDSVLIDSDDSMTMESDAMEIEMDLERGASKSQASLPRGVLDIDEGDVSDPLFVVEYIGEIFSHLRSKEDSVRVDPNYMDRQGEITRRHRTIMIDWMAEVIVKFSLLSETMFLAVHIIDRFLQLKNVSKSKFQLVGIAAMLIASKFEEIYTPKADDFIYIAANAYTREELLKMEKMILINLDFNLNVPSPLHFLRRYSKAAHSDSVVHTLSKYYIELTTLEYSFLEYTPSQIAAASVYLARATAQNIPNIEGIGAVLWNPTIQHYTGYSLKELSPCIRLMNEYALKQGPNCSQKAIFRKYSSPKLLQVASIPQIQLGETLKL
eukprot:TRINITY_DN7000_c0_g1_i1.p1 TRINITY_DN7000_c0_g1~~TRINITY_DN7000_c0_g1_i1.p1  ORF type:complete len:485 (-),score=150.89 TRINITY_DN7000_c0_g1_i1:51-1505(-)